MYLLGLRCEEAALTCAGCPRSDVALGETRRTVFELAFACSRSSLERRASHSESSSIFDNEFESEVRKSSSTSAYELPGITPVLEM